MTMQGCFGRYGDAMRLMHWTMDETEVNSAAEVHGSKRGNSTHTGQHTFYDYISSKKSSIAAWTPVVPDADAFGGAAPPSLDTAPRLRNRLVLGRPLLTLFL